MRLCIFFSVQKMLQNFRHRFLPRKETFMSEVEWMEIFSENLQEIMQERGYSQKRLADESGLDQGTISRYLNHKQMPSVRAIVNIVWCLGCNYEELMDFGDMIDWRGIY